MRESLHAGGGFDLGGDIYDHIGMPELRGVGKVSVAEDPVLGHRLKTRESLDSPEGFRQFFRLREQLFPGYSQLADQFVDTLKAAGLHKEGEPEGELFGYRVQLKPFREPESVNTVDSHVEKRALAYSNTIRLYDFEDLPASRAFLEMALHVSGSTILVGLKDDEDEFGARLYAPDIEKNHQAGRPNLYLVERAGLDELGRYRTLEVFRGLPYEFQAVEQEHSGNAAETQEEDLEKTFLEKAATMVNYFMEKTQTDPAAYSDYDHIANSVARKVRELSRTYDDQNAPRSEILPLKPPKTAISDARYNLLSDQEQQQYAKDTDGSKIYDDNIPEPTRDLLLLANRLLEEAELYEFSNVFEKKTYFLGHGLVEGKPICLVEEKGSDDRGDYLSWQVYTGTPWQFYKQYIEPRPTTGEPSRKEMNKFRRSVTAEIRALPEIREPQRVKRAIRRLKSKQERKEQGRGES